MPNKILIFGDVCTDINYYGQIRKISPEAPIPVFEIESKEEKPGMAENILLNVERAGNEAILYSKEDFVREKKTLKSRYFVGNHYCYRIDEDEKSPLKPGEQKIILDRIKSHTDAKAVILQDYNKGFFTENFIHLIIETVRIYIPNAVIIADGHKSRNPKFYVNVDYLKLNEEEYEALSKKEDILDFVVGGVILTRGNRGSTLFTKNNEQDFPSVKVETKDVTGAGDTFVSWFASEIAKGSIEEKAMTIASKAASISVEHLGCYAPTEEEVNGR